MNRYTPFYEVNGYEIFVGFYEKRGNKRIKSIKKKFDVFQQTEARDFYNGLVKEQELKVETFLKVNVSRKVKARE